MDQVKAGAFLRELRKEKGLTQEQLAEQFQVAGRTVSRWETGSNMPDLSILIELADFYKVDIREIIDGERRSENMEEEMKDTLLKVADYTDGEKEKLLKRIRLINIVGLMGIMAGLVMTELSFSTLPVYNYIKGFGFGLGVGALIATIMYATGLLEKIGGSICSGKKKLIMAVIIIFAAVTFLAALVRSDLLLCIRNPLAIIDMTNLS